MMCLLHMVMTGMPHDDDDDDDGRPAEAAWLSTAALPACKGGRPRRCCRQWLMRPASCFHKAQNMKLYVALLSHLHHRNGVLLMAQEGNSAVGMTGPSTTGTQGTSNCCATHMVAVRERGPDRMRSAP